MSLGGESGSHADNDRSPTGRELFNMDQLRCHATKLAFAHVHGEGRGDEKLLPRLQENECCLLGAYGDLNAAVHNKTRISPIVLELKGTRFVIRFFDSRSKFGHTGFKDLPPPPSG